MIPPRRRVPPKGNPGEQPTAAPSSSFVTAPPSGWGSLILFAMLTSGVGLLTAEGLRALFGWVKSRRKAPADYDNPARAIPPGRLENGSFQLPLPDGVRPQPISGPAHVGFARPQLVNVNDPMGMLQHQLQQQNAQMQQLIMQNQQYQQAAQQQDYRLQRMESMLQSVGQTG